MISGLKTHVLCLVMQGNVVVRSDCAVYRSCFLARLQISEEDAATSFIIMANMSIHTSLSVVLDCALPPPRKYLLAA